MSDLAIAFLERWIEENVSAVPGERQEDEAERLAAACISDAAKEGITEEELEEVTAEASDGDDLITYMSKAINRAAHDALDELDDEDVDH